MFIVIMISLLFFAPASIIIIGMYHVYIYTIKLVYEYGEQYPCKPDIFAKTYIKYGQANKMEQIAAMFGKKLNEEFTIKYEGKCYKAYFKKSGIRVRGLYYMDWDNVLVGLLTRDVTIVG